MKTTTDTIIQSMLCPVYDRVMDKLTAAERRAVAIIVCHNYIGILRERCDRWLFLRLIEKAAINRPGTDMGEQLKRAARIMRQELMAAGSC